MQRQSHIYAFSSSWPFIRRLGKARFSTSHGTALISLDGLSGFRTLAVEPPRKGVPWYPSETTSRITWWTRKNSPNPIGSSNGMESPSSRSSDRSPRQERALASEKTL